MFRKFPSQPFRPEEREFTLDDDGFYYHFPFDNITTNQEEYAKAVAEDLNIEWMLHYLSPAKQFEAHGSLVRISQAGYQFVQTCRAKKRQEQMIGITQVSLPASITQQQPDPIDEFLYGKPSFGSSHSFGLFSSSDDEINTRKFDMGFGNNNKDYNI